MNDSATLFIGYVCAGLSDEPFIRGAVGLLTMVAIGAAPAELVTTTIIARQCSHDEVGLGTILVSNIFNGLFIVPVAANIHLISVPWQEVGLSLAIGFAALLCTYPPRSGFIPRSRGILLLTLYGGYLFTILHP